MLELAIKVVFVLSVFALVGGALVMLTLHLDLFKKISFAELSRVNFWAYKYGAPVKLKKVTFREYWKTLLSKARRKAVQKDLAYNQRKPYVFSEINGGLFALICEYFDIKTADTKVFFYQSNIDEALRIHIVTKSSAITGNFSSLDAKSFMGTLLAKFGVQSFCACIECTSLIEHGEEVMDWSGSKPYRFTSELKNALRTHTLYMYFSYGGEKGFPKTVLQHICAKWPHYMETGFDPTFPKRKIANRHKHAICKYVETAQQDALTLLRNFLTI